MDSNWKRAIEALAQERLVMADVAAAPVAVVVARLGTGDGGLPIPNNTIATTPDHLPNVLIKVITPLASILIRSARVYVQTLVGLIPIGAATNTLGGHDFGVLLVNCAGYALAPAAVCALQNAAELLGDLDKRFPLLRG